MSEIVDAISTLAALVGCGMCAGFGCGIGWHIAKKLIGGDAS